MGLLIYEPVEVTLKVYWADETSDTRKVIKSRFDKPNMTGFKEER